MASGQIPLRPSFPDPARTTHIPRLTSFHHPGYKSHPPMHDVLFSLPTLDTTPAPSSSASLSTSVSTRRGIHFATALLACQVVANNAFDGYLSTDRSGLEQVTLGPDELLEGDKYWFHAHPPFTPESASHSDASQPPSRCSCDKNIYPIVPSFRDWEFPHSRFKSLRWSKSSENQTDLQSLNDTASMPPPPIPTTQRNPDDRCALSGTLSGLDWSHLVPAAEEKWFIWNGMKFCKGGGSLSAAYNRLPLRADLHKVWDSHKFVLVPKGSQGDFVVHVLIAEDGPTCEFAAEWHNVLVRPGAFKGKAHEYIFAKFAQAIFMLVKDFVIGSPTKRRVARLQLKKDPENQEEMVTVVEEFMSGSQLDEAYGGGGSRSASAKRKRPSQDASTEVESDDEDDWDERYERRRDSWYEDTVDGWEHLGHGCFRNSMGAIKYDRIAGEDASYQRAMREELGRGYRRTLWGDVEYDPTAEGEPERGRTRERVQRRQQRGNMDSVDTIPSLTSSHASDGTEDFRSPSPRSSALPSSSSMKVGSPDAEESGTEVGQRLHCLAGGQ